MEFNFRAVDGRSPPPPPFFNHLPERSFLSPMPVNSFPPMPHHSNNGRDLVLRDREREMMIREEIIMAEIARRREIELEVRRDIMLLEREMAARRAEYGSRAVPPHFHWPSQPSPSPPPPPPHWSSSPGPMPMPMLPPPSFVGPEALALLPGDSASDLNASPPVANNEKVIVLDRPKADVIGTKRKAIEPPPTSASNELTLVGSKKKPNTEWSCAICKVTVPREKGLNAHLRGKKHMAKVERLKIQNLGTENAGSLSDSNTKAKLEREPMKIEAEKLSNKYIIVPNRKSKGKVAGDLKNTSGPEAAQQQSGTKERKKKNMKKFTVWCEMCQVGTYSPEVMEYHKKGKKHTSKLLKHSKSDEAAKPSHISLELIVSKSAEDKASSITHRNSSEDIVSKPEVSDMTYKPNGMFFEDSIVLKPEALEIAL